MPSQVNHTAPIEITKTNENYLRRRDPSSNEKRESEKADESLENRLAEQGLRRLVGRQARPLE
jgi:hypothetical protein